MISRTYLAIAVAAAIALIAGGAIILMNNYDDPSPDPVVPDVDPDDYILEITGPNGTVYADLAQTDAAKELIGALEDSPLSVKLQDYGGFEKVGDLGIKLTRSDVSTVTGPGDIVLYNGKSIVIFYGSNSWQYTSLAKVKDASADSMKEFLGSGDITLELSVEKIVN